MVIYKYNRTGTSVHLFSIVFTDTIELVHVYGYLRRMELVHVYSYSLLYLQIQ